MLLRRNHHEQSAWEAWFPNCLSRDYNTLQRVALNQAYSRGSKAFDHLLISHPPITRIFPQPCAIIPPFTISFGGVINVLEYTSNTLCLQEELFLFRPPLQKSTATSLVGFFGGRGVPGKALASPLHPPTLRQRPLTRMVKTLGPPVRNFGARVAQVVYSGTFTPKWPSALRRAGRRKQHRYLQWPPAASFFCTMASQTLRKVFA